MKRKLNNEFVIEVVKYFVENKVSTTITAKHFNLSNSTVHNYCTEYIKELDVELYEKAQETLKHNVAMKNIKAKDSRRKGVENAVKKMIEDKFRELGIEDSKGIDD